MKPTTKGQTAILLVMALAFALTLSLYVQGVPEGATVSSASVDTGPSGNPENRSDSGGTITTMVLDNTQQNFGWKAYVGNVTGTLTLDDSASQTIYQWPLSSTITGEVYASRDNNVDWTIGSISCAAQSTISTEQTFIGGAASDTDSINNTYNKTLHATMQVGVNTITNSSCRAVYTWQADAAQVASEAANFTGILLEDTDNDLVYASTLEQDGTGFDSNTYDFQLIVPDHDNQTVVNYYFYVEIGT
ncbi:hypothetical protein ACFL1B_02365 [Nanoarchaeota archaeon]